MKIRLQIVAGAALAFGAGHVYAQCGYLGKPYPEGGAVCKGHAQFVCGELGGWRRTQTHCDEDTAPRTEPPQVDPSKKGSQDAPPGAPPPKSR